jgi:succinate dehydrogenase / fumarate reductase cytochrome b subunit
MANTLKQRPEYRNIHITQILAYRMPLAGLVSILHRISGALLILLLPFVIWLFDNSLTSEITFDRFASAFTSGLGVLPGWFIKLVCWA